ncbi:hypothetical protein F444_17957 [Phytophthora nicotianae P1976]|uniref:Uncharacterized protein n=1 Tax=Phytophthora nicotianae P1976 TaxID=1317066 RepID=A0A080ZD38_PHYNI|nr:hypothetical protein F444_17957 [Phytophthora nicotianae P1976]
MVQALLHEGIYRGQKVIVRKDGSFMQDIVNQWVAV